MKLRDTFKVVRRLFALIKPLRFYMMLAIIMGFAGHLCATFITISGAKAAVTVLGFDVGTSLNTIFISAGIFAVLRGFLRYAEQTFNHYIAFKLLAHIRDVIFKALRRLCPAKLDGKDRGNLISLITSDIELLEVFYAHTISPVAIALLFALFMSGYIASYHILLGVVALLAFVVIGLIIPVVVFKNNSDNAVSFRRKSGQLSSFVLDSLRGISETLQYDDAQNRLDEMIYRTQELSEDEKSMKVSAGINNAVTGMVILAFDIAFLFTASYLYDKGDIGFDGLVITTVAIMSSFGPFVALANLGSMLQNTFAAAERVLNLIDEAPVVEDIFGEKDIAFGDALAQNVVFSYGDELILNDMSLEVPKGKIIGLVGKSGSGKSTLLKLFMRFYSAQDGSLSIAGVNVENINTVNLRDMQGFVTQETQLFQDSIKNNVKIAKFDASDEEIKEACKKASIHDFIMSLPDNYDTKIGELGDTLSGGERQRLGLARAFLHDAPFLLLDEPTSNLDSLNEAIVLKSLYDEKGQRTVLLVSHRMSTMRVADTVYNVGHGRMS